MRVTVIVGIVKLFTRGRTVIREQIMRFEVFDTAYVITVFPGILPYFMVTRRYHGRQPRGILLYSIENCVVMFGRVSFNHVAAMDYERRIRVAFKSVLEDVGIMTVV